MYSHRKNNTRQPGKMLASQYDAHRPNTLQLSSEDGTSNGKMTSSKDMENCDPKSMPSSQTKRKNCPIILPPSPIPDPLSGDKMYNEEEEQSTEKMSDSEQNDFIIEQLEKEGGQGSRSQPTESAELNEVHSAATTKETENSDAALRVPLAIENDANDDGDAIIRFFNETDNTNHCLALNFIENRNSIQELRDIIRFLKDPKYRERSYGLVASAQKRLNKMLSEVPLSHDGDEYGDSLTRSRWYFRDFDIQLTKDIKIGRNQRTPLQHHPGNMRLMDLVASNFDEYKILEDDVDQRMKLFDKILQKIKDEDRRFFRLDQDRRVVFVGTDDQDVVDELVFLFQTEREKRDLQNKEPTTSDNNKGCEYSTMVASIESLPPLSKPNHDILKTETTLGVCSIVVMVLLSIMLTHYIALTIILPSIPENSGNIEETEYSPSHQVGKIILLTLVYTEAVVALVCTVGVLCADPCVVKRSPETCNPVPLAVESWILAGGGTFNLRPPDLEHYIQGPGPNRRIYCTRCLVWRNTDGKSISHFHCNICQRCCAYHDHHCNVFGRCIAGDPRFWKKGRGSCGNILYFHSVIISGVCAFITIYVAFAYAISMRYGVMYGVPIVLVVFFLTLCCTSGFFNVIISPICRLLSMCFRLSGCRRR